MFKNVLKILFIVLGLAGLAVVLFVAGFHLFFSEPRIKKMITDVTRASVARDTTLGHAAAGIFSGLTLRDYALSEKAGFKDGTFVSCKTLTVRAKLPSLLQRRLAISSIVIDEPKVSIFRRERGSYNYSDIVLPSRYRNTAGATLLISDVQIHNGEVRFTDPATRLGTITVKNISLVSRGVSFRAPFDVTCSGVVTLGKNEYVFDSVIAYDAPADSVVLKEMTINSNGSKLAVAGKCEHMRDEQKRTFEVSFKGDKKLLDSIVSSIPGLELIEFFNMPQINITVVGDKNGIRFRLAR